MFSNHVNWTFLKIILDENKILTRNTCHLRNQLESYFLVILGNEKTHEICLVMPGELNCEKRVNFLVLLFLDFVLPFSDINESQNLSRFFDYVVNMI